MTITVDGIEYATATELLDELKISRQTLWRWRQQGKIPSGRLHRNNKLVFTSEEAASIRGFANRLEPALVENHGQLRLFERGVPGAER